MSPPSPDAVPATQAVTDSILTPCRDGGSPVRGGGSAEASAFVREHLTRILHGDVVKVLASWRRKATCQGLRGAKKKLLVTPCVFLEKNKHRMKHDEYLQRGCLVATGVIEGVPVM